MPFALVFSACFADASGRAEIDPAAGPAAAACGGCGFVLLIVLCVVGFGLYIAPTVVAFVRKHPNAPAILAVNLLLGWSFLGWVVALVWAMTAIESNEEHHYHHYDATPTEPSEEVTDEAPVPEPRRPDMIRFPCPGCGTRLSCHEHRAGRKTTCPKCGRSLFVPPPVRRPTE